MRYRIFLARTPFVSCPPLPDRGGLTEPFPITLKAGEPVPRWRGLRLQAVSEIEGEEARDELLRQIDKDTCEGLFPAQPFMRRGSE
jgi:hypothetical protein